MLDKQKEDNRIYLAIDLKSFYASVECVERGLDALTTNLVVADESRTEKTICLAVTPSLKKYGISGRSRLFEVIQKTAEINLERKRKGKIKKFSGVSFDDKELQSDFRKELGYIIAPPRMALYEEYSSKIYSIYLKYVAPEDIHVYSIDEVFIDITNYVKTYKISPEKLAKKMVKNVLQETKITATVGIGTNLYLAKIAMDIIAKKIPADEDGVRIACLDEMSYRQLLWDYTPITDFWRVGSGYAKKLAQNNMYTMGDVAYCSYYNEDKLYKLFGVNAELLIDHAWGYEPCTIKEVKAYKPEAHSICMGQVLHAPYDYEKTALIVREMTELLSLDLVEKGLETSQIVLTIGYDIENLDDEEKRKNYKGEVVSDRYGRLIPKHAHGTGNLEEYTASTILIREKVLEVFDKIVDKNLLVRRINIAANNVKKEGEVRLKRKQLDLFSATKEGMLAEEKKEKVLEKEKKLQKVNVKIRKKHGKNALIKGMNLSEGATTIERNGEIGGHKA